MIVCIAGQFNAWGLPSEAAKADSLKQKLSESLPDTMRIKSLQALSSLLRDHDPMSSLLYAKEAYDLSSKIQYNIGKAVSLGMMATSYQLIGDYKNALFYYFQSLRISESLKNVKYQSLALGGIGVTYIWLKKYDMAKKYNMAALRLKTKYGFNEYLGSTYNNLGIIAAKQGKVEESIRYFNKAFELGNKYHSEKDIALALSSLGIIYADRKQVEVSKDYYIKSLALFKNDATHQVSCYHGLGILYLKNHNYKLAEKYLIKGKEVAEKSRLMNLLAEIHKALSQLYEKENKPKEALIHHKVFQQLNDSLLNESTYRQITEIQSGYEIEKKNKQIELLNKNRQIAEAKANRENLVRDFFIVAFSLILIVSLVLIRNIILKQNLNKFLHEKNTLIEWQKQKVEQENLVLTNENIETKYEILKSKTNPHFLFNSLTTLSSIVMEDQKLAVTYIECFAELYRMILETTAHELINLSQEMEVVNNYLFLQKVRFNNNLLVDIKINDSMLQSFIPPFALQMVIENVIKHNRVSGKNKLQILIEEEGKSIVIRNNLQKKHSKVTSTSIGQKNISDRYRLITIQQPEFTETLTEYIVKLPLISSADHLKEVSRI